MLGMFNEWMDDGNEEPKLDAVQIGLSNVSQWKHFRCESFVWKSPHYISLPFSFSSSTLPAPITGHDKKYRQEISPFQYNVWTKRLVPGCETCAWNLGEWSIGQAELLAGKCRKIKKMDMFLTNAVYLALAVFSSCLGFPRQKWHSQKFAVQLSCSSRFPPSKRNFPDLIWPGFLCRRASIGLQ